MYDDSLHLQAYRAKHVGGYSIWSHVYGLAQSEYALPEKTYGGGGGGILSFGVAVVV